MANKGRGDEEDDDGRTAFVVLSVYLSSSYTHTQSHIRCLCRRLFARLVIFVVYLGNVAQLSERGERDQGRHRVAELLQVSSSSSSSSSSKVPQLLSSLGALPTRNHFSS